MVTRKQREISERHELILDTARELFIKHGYHAVTMEMIAKEIEYSKGTIYQHFNCKECIITSLCTRFCKLVFNLIDIVGQEKQLNPRLQMLLIQEAFIMLQEKCQEDVQIKNLADSQPFCTKVTAALIEEKEIIEQQTFNVVVGIANRAIENKQLLLPANTSAEDVAIGCWALAHGVYMLTSTNSCACTTVLTDPAEILRTNSEFYFDGVGWMPVKFTDKHIQIIKDYSKQFELIIHNYFPSTTNLSDQSESELN